MATTVFGQNYRFVYEYKFRPDAASKDSLVTDYMNLDTNGKESFFYNAAKFEKDSLFNATKDSKAVAELKNYDRNLTYTVHKVYSGKSIQFYDKFQTANLVIKEEKFPNWKIVKEFKKIGEIDCQKAVSNYRGRSWEVWFSKDYPVNDGPYKFSGLPGLVVQINDTDNDHRFNLIQIKKIKNINSSVPKNNKEMSEKEYRKLWANYRFNPEEISAMNMGTDKTMTIQLKDGYTGKVGMEKLKKTKDMDGALSILFGKTKNTIERD